MIKAYIILNDGGVFLGRISRKWNVSAAKLVEFCQRLFPIVLQEEREFRAALLTTTQEHYQLKTHIQVRSDENANPCRTGLMCRVEPSRARPANVMNNRACECKIIKTFMKKS